jgi:hypothetical protein
MFHYSWTLAGYSGLENLGGRGGRGAFQTAAHGFSIGPHRLDVLAVGTTGWCCYLGWKFISKAHPWVA